jgi:cation:H+ antiporter
MSIALGLLGLIILVVGADLLVRGASRLALGFGIAPLVVGLTVVAFGTSAPELAVSVRTSLAGDSAMALGNAIGSNMFNILAIMGIAAIISPQAVDSKLIRTDVPIMIACAAVVWLVAWSGEIARWEAAILTVLLVIYTGWTVWKARSEPTEIHLEEVVITSKLDRILGSKVAQIAAMAVGLGFLVLGSDLLVDAAVLIARFFGLSEVVIGLTIVAAGTSMPELATTVVAAVRGEREIAVGNVVGSNIFNALGVVGLAGVAGGAIAVPQTVLSVDIPLMFGVSVLVLPIIYTDSRVSRFEGATLLAGLVAYWTWLLV